MLFSILILSTKASLVTFQFQFLCEKTTLLLYPISFPAFEYSNTHSFIYIAKEIIKKKWRIFFSHVEIANFGKSTEIEHSQ